MLSPLTIKQLEQRLTQLLETCQVINAAVVATLDGHLCTMKQRHQQYPLERLATMGSTLMALGDTITAELNMGNCDNLISENKNGIIAFMHINDNLVLVTLTVQKNALGMLLSHSRRCAEEMVQIVSSS
jgi:predicted regulator of Ras-like GTPase activity (Roadblock/LC7/MglB family)